jgi:hypothetical protein
MVDQPVAFAAAAALRRPSYVSLESALAYRDKITAFSAPPFALLREEDPVRLRLLVDLLFLPARGCVGTAERPSPAGEAAAGAAGGGFFQRLPLRRGEAVPQGGALMLRE